MLAQQQSQRQQLKILPQQIQLLNLYFLNSLELQQRIRQELEENPFLEIKEEQSTEDDTKLSKDDVQDFHDWEETAYEDQPDYRADYQNYFDAEVAPNSPIVHIATKTLSQFHQKKKLKNRKVVMVCAPLVENFEKSI